jgi:phage terminase large subunit-like protein
MNPGYKMTTNLLDNAAPEIQKAIDAIYQPDKTYINTKRICDHILEHKAEYPLLSVKIHKVLAQIVTTSLKHQGLKMYTSEKHTRRYGRVFIRVIPSDKE